MISFGPSFKPIVGLDISSSAVKAVELRPAGKRWKIHACGIKPLPEDAVADSQIKDAEAVTLAIQDLFREKKISTKQVATAVSGSAIIIKKIQLPIMPELELEDQISLEAEEYIPFDIDDVNLDFQILGHEEENMDVLLVACKKELINNRLAVLEAAGLKPKVLDLDLFAIETAYDHLLRLAGKGQDESCVALVNVGATLININILTDGVPSFTRDHLFGARHLTEDIERHYRISREEAVRLQEGLEQPEDYQTALLNPFLDQMSLQIGQSLDFYQAAHADNPVKRIILSGGCALLPGAAEFLESRAGVAVQVADPNMILKGGEAFPEFLAAAPRFLVAIGLALRGNDP